MLVINSTEALARVLETPINPDLKAQLARRRDQLGSELDLAEMARFIVVQPGDGVDRVGGRRAIELCPTGLWQPRRRARPKRTQHDRQRSVHSRPPSTPPHLTTRP